jgi:HAD superfamily hydrolase (TIGR01459 family)
MQTPETSLTMRTAFISGLGEIAERYDAIFCDVWGVLHNGMSAHPDAAVALTRFRETGRKVILISNAPRPGHSVIRQLDRLGVPRSAYDDILTSGDLTRANVTERADQRVFHLGPERDLPIFDGLDITFAPAEEADYCVCSGLFDDDTDKVEDYAELLRGMQARGLLMVCANPDIVVERGDTLLPCAGAIAQAYEQLGGEVIYNGKPHRPVYETALARLQALGASDLQPSRVLAVGDAIRTDIAGALEIGADALLIARGIHTHELGLDKIALAPETAEEWLAAQTHRPHAILDKLIWGR